MRVRSAVFGLATAVALALASPAVATTLFWEDFDGYWSFPSFDPPGDPVNLGLPEIAEGADELWFGARFEKPDSACADGMVRCDLAIQKFGSASNRTHVGRFADDAGLLFSVDPTGFADVILSFDWRTFSADSGDQLVAGYFAGDIPLSVFGSDRTADLLTGPYAWASWVELISENAHNTFTHHEFALPSNVGSIWIALWLDNGNHDYGKIDKVHVKGVAVPEPAALTLGLAALALLLRAPRSRPRAAS